MVHALFPVCGGVEMLGGGASGSLRNVTLFREPGRRSFQFSVFSFSGFRPFGLS
jgi:hypothetical protein